MDKLKRIKEIFRITVPVMVPLSLLLMAFSLGKIFNILQNVNKFDDFILTKIDSVYIDNHPDDLISLYYFYKGKKKYIYIIGSLELYNECLGDCDSVIQAEHKNYKNSNLYSLNVPVFYSRKMKQAYYLTKGKNWSKCTLLKEVIFECSIIIITVASSMFGLILRKKNEKK